MAKTKTPTATVRLNAWELVVIEEALRRGLPGVEELSLAALIDKISHAVPRVMVRCGLREDDNA